MFSQIGKPSTSNSSKLTQRVRKAGIRRQSLAVAVIGLSHAPTDLPLEPVLLLQPDWEMSER